MIEHVIDNVKQSGVEQLVTIVGHGAQNVKETLVMHRFTVFKKNN